MYSFKPPSRNSFGLSELLSLIKCGWYYYSNKIDPLYQSKFEQKFCSEFSAYMGNGYTDAVNSGTNASYVAILSLELPKKSIIGISSFCDPGVYNSIIIAGHIPYPLPFKSSKNFLHDFISIRKLCEEKKLNGIVFVHSFGYLEDFEAINSLRLNYKIPIIEDISQSIGSFYKKSKVGTASDICFSSTMGRKALISGSTGGLIYTKSEKIYKNILSFSDSGKSIDSNLKVSSNALKNKNISLNFSSDEFSCAIASASLKRLEKTAIKRLDMHNELISQLENYRISEYVSLFPYSEGSCPFVSVMKLNSKILIDNKKRFSQFLSNNNVPNNPAYLQNAFLWPWLRVYLIKYNEVIFSDYYRLAEEWSKNHIILYIHEGYTKRFCKYIAKTIMLGLVDLKII